MSKVFLISLAVVLAISVGLVGCVEEPPPDGDDGDGVMPLDHFKCYRVEDSESIGEVVYLEDQFIAIEAMVGPAELFCNPVEKWHDDRLWPVSNPNHHLTFYPIYLQGERQWWQVEVDNQFGTQQLTVSGPVGLAVPTQKVYPGSHETPESLDHFLLYEVFVGPHMEGANVNLSDQFGDEQVEVYEATLFANPVRKTYDGNVTEIQNQEAHLVFYAIEGEVGGPQVQVVNQFGNQTLDVSDPWGLAVPSEKTEFDKIEPLDHFKCYTIDPVYIGEDVYLEDQFGAVNATVELAELFCNPVMKRYPGVLAEILNPDHHLTVYNISYEEEPQTWEVSIDNQFGTQNLTVSGPVALAIPTRKVYPVSHQTPEGLDHFLLYDVIEGPSVDAYVDLDDQFTFDTPVPVTEPLYFANPVQKTHDGNVAEIQNQEAHLVFYRISGVGVSPTQVQAINQFGAQNLDVYDPAYLAVPSEKLAATPS